MEDIKVTVIGGSQLADLMITRLKKGGVASLLLNYRGQMLQKKI